MDVQIDGRSTDIQIIQNFEHTANHRKPFVFRSNFLNSTSTQVRHTAVTYISDVKIMLLMYLSSANTTGD